MGEVAVLGQITAEDINGEYRKARSSMVDSANHILNVGRMLTKKKKELGHRNFIPWVEAECDFKPRAAQRMMKAYAKASSTTHLTEAEAAQISRDTWGNEKGVSALYSSESVEWYTPQKYIEAVHDCLGNVDLDPASCASANETVGARNIFTHEDDGLSQDWFGNVFMNPPYGKKDNESLAGLFCRKAISEYKNGNIESCIILVNSLHSQEWQRPLWGYTACLVDHRIKFISGDGSENENPTMQNAFFYLGEDVKAFKTAFSVFGYVVAPV